MVVLSGMNEMSQMEENIRIADKYDYNTFPDKMKFLYK